MSFRMWIARRFFPIATPHTFAVSVVIPRPQVFAPQCGINDDN